MRRAPSVTCQANRTLHKSNFHKPTCSAIPSASACSFRRSALSGQRLAANLPSRTAARGSVLVRSEQPDIKDRAISALPYLVPLFDGLRYGADFPPLFFSVRMQAHLRCAGAPRLCHHLPTVLSYQVNWSHGCVLRRQIRSGVDAVPVHSAVSSGSAVAAVLRHSLRIVRMLSPKSACSLAYAMLLYVSSVA